MIPLKLLQDITRPQISKIQQVIIINHSFTSPLITARASQHMQWIVLLRTTFFNSYDTVLFKTTHFNAYTTVFFRTTLLNECKTVKFRTTVFKDYETISGQHFSTATNCPFQYNTIQRVEDCHWDNFLLTLYINIQRYFS